MSSNPHPEHIQCDLRYNSSERRFSERHLPWVVTIVCCLLIITGTGATLALLVSRTASSQDRINFVPYFIIWFLLSILILTFPLLYVQRRKARQRGRRSDIERHFYCSPWNRNVTITRSCSNNNNNTINAFGIDGDPGPTSATCRTALGTKHVTLAGATGRHGQRQDLYPPLPPSGSTAYMDMVLANYVGSGKPLPDLPGPPSGEINPPRQSQIERNHRRTEQHNGNLQRSSDASKASDPKTPTKSSLGKPRIDSDFWRMISSIGTGNTAEKPKPQIDDSPTPKSVPADNDDCVFTSGHTPQSDAPSTPTRRPRSMSNHAIRRPLRRMKRPVSVNDALSDAVKGGQTSINPFSGSKNSHERKRSLQISDRPQRITSLNYKRERPLSAPLYRSSEDGKVNFSLPLRSVRVSPPKEKSTPDKPANKKPSSPSSAKSRYQNSSSPLSIYNFASTPSSRRSKRITGETSSTENTSPSINGSLRVTRPGTPAFVGSRMKPLPEVPLDDSVVTFEEKDNHGRSRSPLGLNLCEREDRWIGCTPYEGT